MTRVFNFAAIAVPMMISLAASAVDVPSQQVAARTELHLIESMTLAGQQFLKSEPGSETLMSSLTF